SAEIFLLGRFCPGKKGDGEGIFLFLAIFRRGKEKLGRKRTSQGRGGAWTSSCLTNNCNHHPAGGGFGSPSSVNIGSNLSLDLSACIESGMPPIMQVERKLVGEVATSDSESTSSLVRSFAAEQVPLAAATDQQQQQQQQQQQHAVREFFGESTSQSGSQVAERSSESPGQVAMSQVESLAETSSPKVPTPNIYRSRIGDHVEEAIEAVVQRARDGPLEMPAFRTPPEKHHPPANAHQHKMLANLAMQTGINFGLDQLGLSTKPDQLFACYNDQVPFGAYHLSAALGAAGGRGSYQPHPSPNDTGASYLNFEKLATVPSYLIGPLHSSEGEHRIHLICTDE
ncbi:conserved hypothetical protein, partial [Trichinella spiralis]|uniref:hypothetical protein n=1 Tax=Trichinella spiralis TaxID=6334 RepID=UPI0001EFDAF0